MMETNNYQTERARALQIVQNMRAVLQLPRNHFATTWDRSLPRRRLLLVVAAELPEYLSRYRWRELDSETQRALIRGHRELRVATVEFGHFNNGDTDHE